jgi:peptide/nickel transport system ATP-binding protein
LTDLALDVRSLTVRLPPGADRPHAVEDVSIGVRRGEIVCIVGESGSGKSVTAFTVMGLLPKGDLVPTAGEVLLEGEDVLKATPARLRELRGTRMAMIFQEPMTALNPVLTVGDQIDEVLRIHTDLGAPERRAKALDIMSAIRLPDPERIYNSYPHQLSGGQRQRIMIAAAIVLDPHLLIADEPTTALDVTTQAQILGLIKDLQARRGTGVLFITHDFGVVAEIADRVVVMQRGRVVEEGPAEEVLRHSRHDLPALLIGGRAKPRSRAPRGGHRTGGPGDREPRQDLRQPGASSAGPVVRAAADVSPPGAARRDARDRGQSGSGKTRSPAHRPPDRPDLGAIRLATSTSPACPSGGSGPTADRCRSYSRTPTAPQPAPAVGAS